MDLDLPRIFLLSTHLKADELHKLEDQIPTLTYDINEAEIVLGSISRRERAMFELRRAKLETTPLEQPKAQGDESQKLYVPVTSEHVDADNTPSPKRRRVTERPKQDAKTIKVVKLAWLRDSVDQGKTLPVEPYTLYEGTRAVPTRATPASTTTKDSSPATIIERAIRDHKAKSANSSPRDRHKRRPDTSTTLSQHPPNLLHQTTSEHDIVLPLVPEYLQTTFSCQRPTVVNPPNEVFIEALTEVRDIRQLHGDEVGVRAYSTAIASLAAYPHLVQNTQGKFSLLYHKRPIQLRSSPEVARLPGCSGKIAELWHQWKETGELGEIQDANADPMISSLKQFYNIWGVGDVTAREFYRKGWRDLDDLVQYGWNSLSRSQQIGVKYFDEFLLKIPRDEVASIGATILRHARQIDSGFEMVIVGGYRRGKQQSGDVDVVLSHRDESKTLEFVQGVTASLENAHFITHTLTLSLHNSERGQRPVSWKGEGTRGSGFDTLDKAMVVWQDPAMEDAPHRRVDIIVSPWKTVGCAVMGWSAGTTFQRDVRRYCKKVKGLKFDSSGIRRRADGMWVDLEGSSAGDAAPDMETAERRVFEGLGLDWRSPEERCTG
ncbi:hypothetical protein FZEAL_10369 [Fusarium zealandicum]|uniref:DNA polymerase n=1 Tax=Fusarium zealandicum TaxID=1053134 RepID=A0A8H4U2G4_9HYPO|nr:hypothetical protein FZEAL_10369 [Fusarium zealandicum]